MAFATMAGLAPAAGLYATIVMGLVAALLASSPKLSMGPAVTTSTMVAALLSTVAHDQPQTWAALAGFLAVLVGAMTLLAALLNVGKLVKFVSRSVLAGLTAGSAILIIGAQLAPLLGLPSPRATNLLAMIGHSLAHLHQTSLVPLLLGGGTMALTFAGGWLGPRFPAAAVALAASGVAAWLLQLAGHGARLATIGELPRGLPTSLTPWYSGPYDTDLIVGAAAICFVGIVQTLTIAKVLAARDRRPVDAKRDLIALGVANIAGGALHGFPGTGSFARSALNDLAGARTRFSGVVTAGVTLLVLLSLAPLAKYITTPAIAGLLIATALSMLDWGELRDILLHDRHDRMVLLTTVGFMFILPIHWAVLIGLALAAAIFLVRVSYVHLVEMVNNGEGRFLEHAVDAQTGRSRILMLQVEGPLFFAHAEELGEILRRVFRRGPAVTILRMRRTKQIDFSVITALEEAVEEYQAGGGRFIICGLTPTMRRVLAASPLGRVIPPEYMLETTGEVFGSAHQAIAMAERLVASLPDDGRPLMRTAPYEPEG